MQYPDKIRSTVNRFPLVFISLGASLAILLVRVFNTLVFFHLFSLENYLALVAIVFFISGYFLSMKKKPVFSKAPLAADDMNDDIRELKAIRFDLSNREFCVFGHLAQGRTNKEIAAGLGISVSTVKTHINNLFSKTGCRSRKEAIAKWALMAESGIV